MLNVAQFTINTSFVIMCLNLVLLLIFAFYVAAVTGDNGTSPNNCGVIRSRAYFKRKHCVTDYVKHEIGNDTVSNANGTCVASDDVKNIFLSNYTNSSVSSEPLECFGKVASVAKSIETSMQTRYELLINAFAEDKVKNFFASGGLQCLNATGQEIIEICVVHLANLNMTQKNWILRLWPFTFTTSTCSRQSKIMTCIKEIITRKCNETHAEFVMSIHGNLKDYCNNTKGTGNFKKSPSSSKSSTTAIVVGCLVALIVIVIIGFAIAKRVCKSSDSEHRAQTYNVAFQERDRSDRKEI